VAGGRSGSAGERDVRAWLNAISEPVILAIDGIALLVIVAGTVQVLIAIVRVAFKGVPNEIWRETFLRYARWLVAALTFQLAADIIETSITTDWQTIGRVGAIALIRTFLNYFLERDVEKQQRACAAEQTRPTQDTRGAENARAAVDTRTEVVREGCSPARSPVVHIVSPEP
jgi:uncharacterized membrane protein